MAGLMLSARLLALLACSWLPLLPGADPCPPGEHSYLKEPSPFGWPMTPAFSWENSVCWGLQYPMCWGLHQAPMNRPIQFKELDESPLCNGEPEGTAGELWRRSHYLTDEQAAATWEGRGTVKVSKHMGTLMIKGFFGTVWFKDSAGHDVEYEATQVHLSAPSLHAVASHNMRAELMVFHKPKGAIDEVDGMVVVSSLLFKSEDDSNPIFRKMGLVPNPHHPHGEEWTVEPFGLHDVLMVMLNFDTNSYKGSLPVPPCSETVTWIQTLSQFIKEDELQLLEDVLSAANGGLKVRSPTPRIREDECRKTVKNSVRVSHNHQADSCAMNSKLECLNRTKNIASCWATGDSCRHAPAIIDPALARRDPAHPVDLTKAARYHAGEQHFEMRPSNQTLDGRVPHSGHFGHLMLHGRRFEATKLSLKPIATHVVSGKRYAGELVIEHQLYGDLHGSTGAHHAHAPAAEEGGHQDGHGHGRRLEDASVEGAHRVFLSVQLTLGKESSLLRSLGLLNPALKLAIRDGNAYPTELDAAAELQPLLKGGWFWYSGTQLKPGCSEWGVRWLVMEEPLEVSYAQLDALALPVTGFDSTPPAVGGTAIWAGTIPTLDVQLVRNADCGSEWSYENTACWGSFSKTCTTGNHQSPINILPSNAMKAGSDSFLAKCSWKPLQGLKVVTTPAGLQVESNQRGYIAFVGETGNQDYYQVTGLTLHMPSEHMIGGNQFDAELQVVHERQITVSEFDSTNQLIASFLFRIGDKESPLLKQLLATDGPKTVQQPLDLMRALGPAIDAGFYRYDGSTTVPGCGEDVKWFVFDSPMEMSRAQWAAFKAIFPLGNSRPVQELHERVVARNSFEEGTLVQQGFYLNRERTRDRADWGRDTSIILIPILFSLFFSIYVMSSLFVREDTDRKAQSNGGLAPAGLEQTIGKPQYRRF